MTRAIASLRCRNYEPSRVHESRRMRRADQNRLLACRRTDGPRMYTEPAHSLPQGLMRIDLEAGLSIVLSRVSGILSTGSDAVATLSQGRSRMHRATTLRVAGTGAEIRETLRPWRGSRL